ncbi:MAG TPA: ornithine carbamoyltransferase [Thermomicrobiales bacterium]|nr:ornithine carbamoyltransferase [Thermomicrobiales bacterium]
MKDLLKTSDLTIEDMHLLLDLAAEFKANPLGKHGLLTGKTVVLYFAKPSTRTRLSFEAAVARLGGVASTVGPQELQIGRGESLEDTAHVVSRYAEAFVIRTYADDDVQLVAEAATIPVINALTDGHHPCQCLADLMTLKEAWGTFSGKQLAYVGSDNNVLTSLMQASAMAGLHLTIATPPGYEPDETLFAQSWGIAKRMGGSVNIMHEPADAVKGSDAVYTDAWLSMGDSELTRAERFAALTPYRVTPQMMSEANPDAVFMHCLPAHRGEEVTAEVIDGPQSIVFDQAENRLHTGQAVLYALITGMLTGTMGASMPATTTANGKVKSSISSSVHAG